MKTYTKREMAHIFNVSPRTIEDDIKFLGIEPQLGDRNMNLYDQNDFNLIEQMRAHLENKLNTRESFVANTKVEIVKVDEVAITRIPLQQTHLVTQLDIYQESIEHGFRGDPLFDLELLQRISDRAFLMSF